MKCLACNRDTGTRDSRDTYWNRIPVKRRRHDCIYCGHRFHTIEISEEKANELLVGQSAAVAAIGELRNTLKILEAMTERRDDEDRQQSADCLDRG